MALKLPIVTMKERVDNKSQYQKLRKGKPGQERLAKNLHREADVPEGPCGYQKLENFQDFVGPQGYQLILVEPSKCLIVFKQSQFNDAPHVIYLVKHHQHYDGLTSFPALVKIVLITVAIAIRRITTRTPPIIILLDKTALPVLEETKLVLPMLPG